MSKLKDTLRLFLPKFVWEFMSVLKIIFSFSGAKNLQNIAYLKKSKNVVVLGNGPSLKNDFHEILDAIENSDFICVNNFCSSKYYEILKPNKYIFWDSYFFSDKAHSDWKIQREETYKLINIKTLWKMQIFVPANVDVNYMKKFIKNENIEIIKIRLAPIDAGYNWLTNLLYDSGFFGPHQCNVLIIAIYLAVWSKYEKVNVYGADLSFHNDITVDQETNQVNIKFRHFNKVDSFEPLLKNPEKTTPFSMYEIMNTTSDTLRGHELLANYVKSKGISIVNCSNFSLIDAYRRPKKRDK